MMENRKILDINQHRPFPLPKSPWIMQQVWEDLLFLHYKIPYEVLRDLVPEELELDTYNGECWISISPFKMRNVRMRLLPPIPTAYNFLELNLRTYVKYKKKGGIYFFSLDTSSTLSAIGARLAFLPYFRASMEINQKGDVFHFSSNRRGKKKAPADFKVTYKPVSEPFFCKKGSLEDWLVERYCLFQKATEDKIITIDIHHVPWPLQLAEAKVEVNSLTAPFDFSIPFQEPLIHYVKSQKVLTWTLRVV